MSELPRILAIGECMAELAPLDLPGNYRLGYAGDTFNTCWYLRRLRPEMAVSYFSAAGTDELSDDMIRFMDEEGIETSHILRIPERTVGLYMISLNDGERSFSYWRDRSAARLLADDETALSRAIDETDLIYFSGITLAVLNDPGRDALINALREARASGKTVAFDPNLRPRLWSDTERMKHVIAQGAAVSDMVLPSFEDETVHFGDADPKATIRRYSNAGARSVIVKDGSAAVHYQHDGEIGEVPVKPVTEIVDTTSAGDSFNAGFLATFGTLNPVAKRIAMSNSVAGQAVGGKGALVPISQGVLHQFQV